VLHHLAGSLCTVLLQKTTGRAKRAACLGHLKGKLLLGGVILLLVLLLLIIIFV
jgi:hypothetical protein